MKVFLLIEADKSEDILTDSMYDGSLNDVLGEICNGNSEVVEEIQENIEELDIGQEEELPCGYILRRIEIPKVTRIKYVEADADVYIPCISVNGYYTWRQKAEKIAGKAIRKDKVCIYDVEKESRWLEQIIIHEQELALDLQPI